MLPQFRAVMWLKHEYFNSIVFDLTWFLLAAASLSGHWIFRQIFQWIIQVFQQKIVVSILLPNFCWLHSNAWAFSFTWFSPFSIDHTKNSITYFDHILTVFRSEDRILTSIFRMLVNQLLLYPLMDSLHFSLQIQRGFLPMQKLQTSVSPFQPWKCLLFMCSVFWIEISHTTYSLHFQDNSSSWVYKNFWIAGKQLMVMECCLWMLSHMFSLKD